VIVRQCVRAILERPDEAVLLMCLREPEGNGSFWVTPGGGTEPGEDDRTALSREVFEETGYLIENEVPPVWFRDTTFEWWGKTYRQKETFYWVRCSDFAAVPNKLTDIEHQSFVELRWWHLHEIDQSSATFWPRDFAERVQTLRDSGTPRQPIVVDT